MTAVGKIKEIDGARVVVSVNREGACGGNCASCGGCTGKAADVSASCNIDVSVGAVVEISSPSKYILLGLIAVFLLPVILPVAGYVIFAGFGITAAWVAAVILFVVSVALIIYMSRSESYLKRTTPTVIRVLNKK